MRVIVVANQKGGVGKTTVSTHLGVEASLTGRTVLLDLDPQGSLASWWTRREAEAPEYRDSGPGLTATLAACKAEGVDTVIIDTPPSKFGSMKAVLSVADLVLIPIKAGPHDLIALGPTLEMAEDSGRPIVFLLTQTVPRSRLTNQALTVLSQHGTVAPVHLGNRIDYASSAIDGRTVRETNPDGTSAGEVTKLHAYIIDRLHKGARHGRHVSVA